MTAITTTIADKTFRIFRLFIVCHPLSLYLNRFHRFAFFVFWLVTPKILLCVILGNINSLDPSVQGNWAHKGFLLRSITQPQVEVYFFAEGVRLLPLPYLYCLNAGMGSLGCMGPSGSISSESPLPKSLLSQPAMNNPS